MCLMLLDLLVNYVNQFLRVILMSLIIVVIVHRSFYNYFRVLDEMTILVMWNLYPCYGHAPPISGALLFLCMLYLIVVSWSLGRLCRVGCRYLHVPQNSRQP